MYRVHSQPSLALPSKFLFAQLRGIVIAEHAGHECLAGCERPRLFSALNTGIICSSLMERRVFQVYCRLINSKSPQIELIYLDWQRFAHAGQLESLDSLPVPWLRQRPGLWTFIYLVLFPANSCLVSKLFFLTAHFPALLFSE